MKTVSVDDHRVVVNESASAKLASLKLAYQSKHGTNIKFKTIVERLIKRAKLKDIE